MAAAGAISCGERLVEYLAAYGIDTVFGIPGNHTVQLYRGLAASSIRHVSPRHEQGAAFMADGYARATGRPAACFLISGPGLVNALTPIMQALADSIPMLVISSVAPRAQLAMGEGRLHELPDQRALASQCCRFSHTLMRVDELPKVLARAFAVFSSARPGPVHIELPLDVIVDDAAHVPPKPWPLVKPPAGSLSGIRELATRFANAKAPCLLIGGGAVGASIEVRQFAERVGVPVVNTVNAKGVLPPSHPLLLGGSPSLASVREFLLSSDVVLAIGTEFGETDYDMLFEGEFPKLPWLARIDIDAAQLCRNQPADLLLCGDAKESLCALLEALPESTAFPVSTAGEGGANRVIAARNARVEEAHVHPDIGAFFATLRDALPNLCLVGDSTLPTYYAVWQYEAPAPRRYFHSATGGGTLGYAIPAAIGARRALNAAVPVVALIGDGAAQFTFMELAAAVQERLPVTVLIWNNSGYAEIRAGMVASEVTPIGVDITPPDFIKAAQALGCNATHVNSLEALADALKLAQNRDVPTVIELAQADFVSTPVGTWYEV